MEKVEIITALKRIKRIAGLHRSRWFNPPARYDYKGNFDMGALADHVEEELADLIKRIREGE